MAANLEDNKATEQMEVDCEHLHWRCENLVVDIAMTFLKFYFGLKIHFSWK